MQPILPLLTHPVTSSTKAALTLQQAVAQAPTLARLSELATLSAARLNVIRPLLPAALRPLVQAGAPDADGWTLLVPHNAAAAKLRQMAPALTAALTQAGHPGLAIRVKVLRPSP